MLLKTGLSLQISIHTYKSPYIERYAILYVWKKCRNDQITPNRIFFGYPLLPTAMITPELIRKVKAVSIVEYLAAKGIYPVAREADELLYNSPLREDRHPSFYVNPKSNVFKDFARDEHRGDAITLVVLLEGCGFAEAVQRLSNFTGFDLSESPVLFLSAANTLSSPEHKIRVLKECPLTHSYLMNYVLSRGIPLSLANRYLKQIHYSNQSKLYWGVGFKNDSKGYELRSAVFKGASSPKDVTTFAMDGQHRTAAVFEGFFDFLSALVWFGLEVPRMPTIILNSTSNRQKAIGFLRQFDKLNCFLDRDKEGFECLRLLRDRDGLPVNDCSKIYEGYKDFNEYLQVRKDLNF